MSPTLLEPAAVSTPGPPVALARELAQAVAARGADFLDAPVARTAQAARDGTLSIMVGGEAAVFERLQPRLACIACMGSEVTHCGAAGAGQAVKLMNNIVVVQTVVALAEALALARASGAVDPRVLFETLTKGSADSFVLRNHGMKSLRDGRRRLRARVLHGRPSCDRAAVTVMVPGRGASESSAGGSQN